MDLAKVEEHLQILRQRREHLPEIRDYKIQSRGKAKKAADVATPIGARESTDVFACLFNQEETNEAVLNNASNVDTDGSGQAEGVGGSSVGEKSTNMLDRIATENSATSV